MWGGIKISEINIVNSSAQYTPPTASIDTQRLGQWKYSPLFVNGQYSAAVRIELNGRRTADYGDAEDDTGISHYPKMTVWHHVHDYNPHDRSCTMQLVPWATHVATIPHAGGCKQYSEDCGGRYRANKCGNITFYERIYIPRNYSGQELKEFGEKFGIEFTPFLVEIYTGKVNIADLKFCPRQQSTVEEPQIDFVAPLWNDSSDASIEAMLSIEWIEEMSRKAKWIPFAGDAFGNIFFCSRKDTIIFLDHESGEPVEFTKEIY